MIHNRKHTFAVAKLNFSVLCFKGRPFRKTEWAESIFHKNITKTPKGLKIKPLRRMNTDFAESDLNTKSKQEQEFSLVYSMVKHFRFCCKLETQTTPHGYRPQLQ